MRVEQEQKVTEDARRFAEQDATAQRYASQVLQVTFSLSNFIIAILFHQYLPQTQAYQFNTCLDKMWCFQVIKISFDL